MLEAFAAVVPPFGRVDYAGQVKALQAQLHELMQTLGHGKDEAGKTGGKPKA